MSIAPSRLIPTRLLPALEWPSDVALNPFVKQGLAFEARATEIQQHDPWPIIVGNTVYVFYAYYNGTHIGISYASCSLSDYLANPTNLVRHGSWVVEPLSTGLGDVYHTAPCVFPRPDGSWFMFTHIYNGTDRGYLNRCSADQFPNDWDSVGITIDAEGDEAWIHPEAYAPPEETPSGLWECVYATCPVAGYPWVGRRATSPTGLPGTWTRRGIVMRPTGSIGDFDSIGVHPIGKIRLIGNGLFLGTYQGYDNATWRPGMYVTKDFYNFTRSPYGPIWYPNPEAGYDHGSIEAPSLLFLPGGRVDLWATTSTTFTASPGTGGGDGYQIARATLA